MHNTRWKFLSFFLTMLLMSHSSSGQQNNEEQKSVFADVMSVKTSGLEGNYTFEVEVSSPDTGCEQYADWWEVVANDGSLLYRRILTHSHVNEQPFKRTGGPVEINADQNVWIRAHMNNSGYGGMEFFGSVEEGFKEMKSDSGFAANLQDISPKPQGCGF